jgi:hypothetical protein
MIMMMHDDVLKNKLRKFMFPLNPPPPLSGDFVRMTNRYVYIYLKVCVQAFLVATVLLVVGAKKMMKENDDDISTTHLFSFYVEFTYQTSN